VVSAMHVSASAEISKGTAAQGTVEEHEVIKVLSRDQVVVLRCKRVSGRWGLAVGWEYGRGCARVLA
jgi:hypothetical protein